MKIISERSKTQRREEIEVGSLREATLAAYLIAETNEATENPNLRISIAPCEITLGYDGEAKNITWIVTAEWFDGDHDKYGNPYWP